MYSTFLQKRLLILIQKLHLNFYFKKSKNLFCFLQKKYAALLNNSKPKKQLIMKNTLNLFIKSKNTISILNLIHISKSVSKTG
jgi:hypothetical protein